MQTSVVPIFESGDYDVQIARACEVLRQGGTVVIPTETVYGAAGRLDLPRAVASLKALRPGEPVKPLTIHLARREDAQRYLGTVGELGQRMMKKLWPGPVSLIFEVASERRHAASSDLGVSEQEIFDGSTITLRCPDHIVASDVLSRAGGPVAAVRAGIGANQPALRADQVVEELQGKVDLILDAGPSRYSKPSTIIRVGDHSYEVVRAGVYDERIIERLLRTTILFVCSGNTCRSPMAEAIARHTLAQKMGISESELDKKGINVISAGSMAMPGSRATPQAVDAVRELGADLSRHRSRPLSVELIHQADFIFTMSRAHAQAVTALVPSAAEKTTTLAPDRDVDDPIGGDAALYHTLAGQLQTLIENRLKEKTLV